MIVEQVGGGRWPNLEGSRPWHAGLLQVLLLLQNDPQGSVSPPEGLWGSQYLDALRGLVPLVFGVGGEDILVTVLGGMGHNHLLVPLHTIPYSRAGPIMLALRYIRFFFLQVSARDICVTLMWALFDCLCTIFKGLMLFNQDS